MNLSYNLGDHVVMKKEHPCKTNEFIITRVGVDIKIKCLKCNHEIMMERLEFDRKVKKVIKTNE